MWASASGSITTNGFTQSYTITDVNRDASSVIVTAPAGTIDPSTKKIDITISWTKPYTSAINSTLYLTRWRENLSYTETTQAQFNAGTKTSTTVRASNPPQVADDGEIILGAGGNGNWCLPNLASSNINLQGGTALGVWAKEGEVYVTTGQSASGLPLTKISISNTNPPIATQVGSSTLNYKGNQVAVDGNYAYIATDNNFKEIVAVDVSTPPPYNNEVGYFDVPGNEDGESVFITSDYGYMTSENKLYNFNKVGNNLPLDSNGVTLDGQSPRLFVVGNYAYVSIRSGPKELNIVDISNPTNLTQVGRLDVNPGVGGKDIAVSSDANTVYLVTSESSTRSEFYIIDTTSKTNPTPISGGTFDTSPMDPRAINIVPGNLVVIVGWNGSQYHVINVSIPSSPSRCDTFPAQSFNINDIATVKETDGDVYSYLVTNDNGGEFKIIAGGPGGAYSSEGTFESQTFNPGYQTADNRFEANFSQPVGTTIQFQVALANLESGVCPSSYTFVGQDGTTNTWFPLTPTPGLTSFSAPFPFGSYAPNYSNPGQCFRYKSKFSTTDQNNTPVLYDFTINYSP